MKKSKKIVLLLLLALLIFVAVRVMFEDESSVETVNSVEDVNPAGNENDAADEQEAMLEKEEPESSEEVDDKEVSNGDAADKENTVMLAGDIKVSGFGEYVGSYVEDGTDEYVGNVAMITLENLGNTYVQLAQVTINDEYVFEVTTLFPGEKVIVLEKNRALYAEGTEVQNAEIGQVAVFDEAPTMCEEIVNVEVEENVLYISNVSGKEFKGGKLFFKNTLDDKYLGGITYFVTLPELADGQGVQLVSSHFEEGRSELLFVTYAE